MKHFTSAGIITFFLNGDTREYLLLRYRTGHWDFPKGKLEGKETLQEAAHRELMEETGLAATIVPGFQDELSYVFTDYDRQRANKTVIFFVGQTNSKEIKLSSEHIDYQWLAYPEAIDRLTYKNARIILHKAEEFLIAQK